MLALTATCVLFLALGILMRLRPTQADEYDGLDLADHDIGSYPDFQQTMIKSYHLREA
jgi:ammonia channel protein AmtB